MPNGARPAAGRRRADTKGPLLHRSSPTLRNHGPVMGLAAESRTVCTSECTRSGPKVAPCLHVESQPCWAGKGRRSKGTGGGACTRECGSAPSTSRGLGNAKLLQALAEASGMSRLRETGRDPDHFSSTSRGLGNAKVAPGTCRGLGDALGFDEDRWRQMLKTPSIVLNLFSDILLSDRQMKSL